MGAASASSAAPDLVEDCAESFAIATEVLMEETEETVEVTEEDDTDVSELLPEFNSSCIVDKTRQASMRLDKYIDVARAAVMQCNTRERLG